MAEGRLEEAANSYLRAAALDTCDAVACLNLGFVRLEQQRHGEALESLERAASLDPALADAPYLMGRAHDELGQLEDAARCFEQASSINPTFAQAWRDLGRVRLALGDADRAVHALEAALRVQGDYALAKLDLATALLETGRGAEALAWAEAAITALPDEAAAEICRARALHAVGRLEEAVLSCDRALALDPGHVPTLYGRAVVLIDLRRFSEALENLDAALARPVQQRGSGLAPLLQARSVALSGQWRYQEAVESARAAVQADPSSTDHWRVLASALQGLGRHDDALEVYRQALACHPEDAQLRWDESLCRLLVGDFAEGWVRHEWRLRAPIYASVEVATQSSAPRWDGDLPISGRRLLLHAEQGLGDAIQFARYVPLVLGAGAEVVLQVPRPLVRLMERLQVQATRTGFRALKVIGTDDPVPAHDLRCSVMSLPALFQTGMADVPASIPYLTAEPELRDAWSGRLDVLFPGQKAPRVGLVWSGNPRHHNDHNRSLPLADLLTAIPPGIDLIGLQPEGRASDRAAMQGLPGLPLGTGLSGFNDTAALIEALDLVISVDTSVAHLTGALGRPLWLLLPHNPDWRWLLGREDTPWYPTCRLFRQDTPGRWDGALQRLREALLRLQAQGMPGVLG